MQTNGVVIENGSGLSEGGKAKFNVSNGTCDEDEDVEVAGSFASGLARNGKRKQSRKLSGIEADTIRLMGQHLREMGYHKTLESLIGESDCPLEHPKASAFRALVLAGDWEKAGESLQELAQLLDDRSNIEKMRLLLLQEKYLEQLESGQELDALHTLRHELAPLPLHHSDKRIQVLTGYMMYPNKDDLRQAANWPGVEGGSRQRLVDELQGYLPASVMLPPKRLHHLLNQALQLQVERCPFHYMDQNVTSYSLLTDHVCSRCQFPSETVHTLTDHSDEVWFLEFSNDGHRLASGSKDGQIIIWNFIDCQPHKEYVLKGQSDGIAFLAWSPNDNLLLSCGREDSPEIMVFLTETGEVKCHIQSSAEDSLTCGAWCSDGYRFYVAGNRGQFYHCSMDGTVTGRWEGVRVKALATHPTLDNTVYAADTHSRIRQYNFIDRSSSTIVQESHPIMSFVLSKNGRQALVNVATQGVHVWDMQDRVLLRRYQGVTQGLYNIHSSYGGISDTFIASGSEDHNVYIWHSRQETPILMLKGHSRTVNCVSWNPVYYDLLASASDDGTVRIWSNEERLKTQLQYQRQREKNGLSEQTSHDQTSSEGSMSAQSQTHTLDCSEEEGMDVQHSNSEQEQNDESVSSLSLPSERLDYGVMGIVTLSMGGVTNSHSPTSERQASAQLISGSQSLHTDSIQWLSVSEPSATSLQTSSSLPLSRLRSSSHGQESSVDPESSLLSLDSSNGSTSQGDISQPGADFEEGIQFIAPEAVLIRTSSRTGTDPETPPPDALTEAPPLQLTVQPNSPSQPNSDGLEDGGTTEPHQDPEGGDSMSTVV